jgi:predicted dehydrogenase
VTGRAIRWGIVANGPVASQFVQDLALLPEAHALGVASRQRDRATAFATRYGIPRAYGSWDELAGDPDIDVVYVATAHGAHVEVARLFIEAGKAVLCEKSLTADLATARDLVELARRRGIFLMEAMGTWTHPTIRRIRDLVASGAIGEVTHLHADFGIGGTPPVGHRKRTPELGRGALLDLGVYPVTLAHLFLGTPLAVTAWASMFPEGNDANTGLILGYESGAVATLHAGVAGETAQRAAITGRDGRIEIERVFWRPDTFTLTRWDGSAQRSTLPVGGHGIVHEAQEVMRCLRAGRTESDLFPLDAVLAVMTTLDTALRQVRVLRV